MMCSSCGYDDNCKDEFVGIFVKGADFVTTNKEMCGLFGCPKCNTVKFVTDMTYIEKRKEMYKKQMRDSNIH